MSNPNVLIVTDYYLSKISVAKAIFFQTIVNVTFLTPQITQRTPHRR